MVRLITSIVIEMISSCHSALFGKFMDAVAGGGGRMGNGSERKRGMLVRVESDEVMLNSYKIAIKTLIICLFRFVATPVE